MRPRASFFNPGRPVFRLGNGDETIILRELRARIKWVSVPMLARNEPFLLASVHEHLKNEPLWVSMNAFPPV